MIKKYLKTAKFIFSVYSIEDNNYYENNKQNNNSGSDKENSQIFEYAPTEDSYINFLLNLIYIYF